MSSTVPISAGKGRKRGSLSWHVGCLVLQLRDCHVVVEEGTCVVGIEAVVTTHAPAKLARAEARVSDKEAVVECGTTGVTEAAAPAGTCVVLVLCELEHLRGDVLSDRFDKATGAVGDGGGLRGPPLGFSKNTP